MRFNYVAYTAAGEKLAGTMEADSESAAEQLLWKADYTVVSLKKPLALPSRYDLLPSVFKVKTHDIVSLSRQLSTLLDSGLPLNTALRVLWERRGNPLLRRTLGQVLQDLEAGISFSEACAKFPRVFPSIFVRLIRVGEETGKLEPMLLRSATYLEKQGVLVSRIRRALIYPTFVTIGGLVAVYVLLTWSIPAMSVLFKEYSTDLPATTRVVIALGAFSSAHGKQVALFVVALGIAGFLYSNTASGRKRKDMFLLKLPVLRSIIGGEAVSRLGYTLSTLLSSGLGFNESMEMAATTTDNYVLKDALTATKADVMTGARLSQAMAKHNVFPQLVSQMVSIGEETGKLEANLNLIGEFYEKETERAVMTLTTIIEPAAILGVGGFVGFIAAVMMSTIYGIIKHIG